MKLIKINFLLALILLIASFLRFFNLMHDSPYFFNPDERNMAIAITQFKLPIRISDVPKCLLSQFFPRSLVSSHYTLDPNSCNLNPHFFAYGQFPLYLSYVSDQLTKPFINLILHQLITNNQQPASPARLLDGQAGGLTISFPSAIFWLRFWSTVASTLTVLLVYLITKQVLYSKEELRSKNRELRLKNHCFTCLAGSPRCEAGRQVGALKHWNIAHLSALMVAFSPGLIQSAHFGTTESLLTFLFMASVYLSIKLFSHLSHLSNLSHLRYLLFLSFTIGLAVGSKLTGLFFLIPPLTAITLSFIKAMNTRRKKILIVTLSHCCIIAFIFLSSLIFSAIFSPFNLIDQKGFFGSVFGYEMDVAMGIYEAFYTRQFVNTTPVLFQAEKIFPYTLGWPVFVLGASGLLFSSLNLIKKCISSIIERIMNQAFVPSSGRGESGIKDLRRKMIFSPHDSYFLILASSFLIYFLPNAFLFAKWTRFMTPVFPFFSIFAACFLYQLKSFKIFPTVLSRRLRDPAEAGIFALCALSLLPGLAFMSIYTHEDSRLAASKWIYENIPNNSYILSETANVVDIPLGIPNYNLVPNAYNLTVISFDFYHMDTNREVFSELFTHLEKADYIFIPSRRIFANYPRLSDKYPFATKYYQLLFSGDLGFEKVAEISSYPSLLLFNSNLTPITYNLKPIFTFPDEQAEETFTVFDHPVIRIYKKNKIYDKQYYERLFLI